MTIEEAAELLADCELHAALGLELVEWGSDTCSFRFAPPPLARFRGDPTGGVHGGALATALDTAACFAAIAAVGQDCSTIDLRTDFLRPALDSEFTVRGTLLRAGRALAWADSTILTLQGRTIATGRGTFTW